MKEKDIVDFSQYKKDKNDEYVDENGNPIGCEICYTHEKAYNFFEDDEYPDYDVNVPETRCPKCGKKLIRRNSWVTDNGNAIVSETNYSNPNGEIGFYSIWECTDCKDAYGNTDLYALMPIPISWNANHDIYYTGGQVFLIDKEMEELASIIYDQIMPNINQYIERKMNPKDEYDKKILSPQNVRWWCEGAIEHAVAKYLYDHGLKK